MPDLRSRRCIVVSVQRSSLQMFETDIDRPPKDAAGLLPNLPHLINRGRSDDKWVWVDAVVARCDLFGGGGRIDARGSWRVSISYNFGPEAHAGQFWQTANSYSEPKPLDVGDTLEICINPALPEQYYYPPAASMARFRVTMLLVGAGLGLLVTALGIWHDMPPK